MRTRDRLKRRELVSTMFRLQPSPNCDCGLLIAQLVANNGTLVASTGEGEVIRWNPAHGLASQRACHRATVEPSSM